MAASKVEMRGRVVIVTWIGNPEFENSWDSDWVPMIGREVCVFWTANADTAFLGADGDLNVQTDSVETGVTTGQPYSRLYCSGGDGSLGANQDMVSLGALDGDNDFNDPLYRIDAHDDSAGDFCFPAVMKAIRLHYVKGAESAGAMGESSFRICYDSTEAAGLGFNRINNAIG